MGSIFKKLISRELGEHRYDKYFFCYQRSIENKTYNHKVLENEEIFNDIYNTLKDKDILIIAKMMERLTDSMYLALKISRTYVFAVIVFIAAIVFLIIQGLNGLITLGAIALMTACFLYKTYEYIVNKYCYIDAHIILVYKSVLDKLIIGEDNDKR